MKKNLLLCFLLVMFSLAFSQTTENNTWTWIGGSNGVNQAGVGNLGNSNVNNIPGGRYSSGSWKDNSGNVWLFGGSAFSTPSGFVNNLWKYTTSTKQWMWVSGTNTTGQPGNYGTINVTNPKNQPGSRGEFVTWTDNNGNFWMFGGQGYANKTLGYLNDLWMFNPVTSLWVWVSGDNIPNAAGVYGTLGLASPANKPGARSNAVGWTDNSGDLWLFGGHINKGTNLQYNDLWRFNVSSRRWTCVSGNNTTNQPGIYGTLGSPAINNKPGAREGSVSWKDINGDLWLLGGKGFAGSGQGSLNDLWKFSISTKLWTWIKGDNAINIGGVYGLKGTPAPANKPPARSGAISWDDKNGNFWMFGGVNNAGNYFNDLWRYTPATNLWMWVNGDNAVNQAGVYGTKGITAITNKPGSRDLSTGWTDASGNLCLFGGGHYQNGHGYLNDQWKYIIANDLTITSFTGICLGTPISIAYTASGSFNTGNVFSLQLSNSSGSFTTPATIGRVTATTSGSINATIPVNTPPGNGYRIRIVSTSPVVNGLDNGTDITLSGLPAATITASGPTNFCPGGSVILTASTGTTYLWSNGLTTKAITVRQAGNFTVTVTNAAGCPATSPPVSITTKVDTEPPVVGNLPTLTGECNVTAVPINGMDNCAGVIVPTTTDRLSYGQGTFIIHWNYNDGNGNITLREQTVIVSDVSAPVATKTTLPDMTGECTAWASPPTAVDNCAGTVTGTSTDPQTNLEQGTYIINWKFSDGNGNFSTQTQRLIVKDVTPPSFILPPLPVISLASGCSFVMPSLLNGVNSSDNCENSMLTFTQTPAIGTVLTSGHNQTHSVTITLNDGHGNSTTQVVVITAKDLTNPVITAPDNIVIVNDAGKCTASAIALGSPVFSDNCSGVTTSNDAPPVFNKGTTSVTWTATDAAGNFARAIQTVTVEDREIPVPNITSLPDLTAACSVTAAPPTATDNCSGILTATTTDPLTYSAAGNYVIHWTFTDGSGNIATQQQQVIINSAARPVITTSGPTSFCDGGSVTLSAPSGFTSWLWSNGETTPSILVTAGGRYTVTVTSAGSCGSITSEATEVTLKTALPKPVISTGGPTSFCTGGNVVLSAPPGFTSYLWSNGASTPDITVMTSGSYYVTVTGATGCNIPVSDATVITANPLPAKPLITASGPANLSPGGNITLSVPAGFSSYKWSNNENTPSITVSASGSYSVNVLNANGCKSPESDPFIVTAEAAASTLSVSYIDGDNSQQANNNIRPYLQVNNEGNSPSAYKDITIRYWLTVENFAPMTNLYIDWAQLGSNKIRMKYVKLDQPRTGAFGYIEYSFDASAGNLSAMSNSGAIQSRAAKSDWTNFNEADDYSYTNANSYTKNNKITLYLNGSLLWGNEPAVETSNQVLKAYSQNNNNQTTTNSLGNYIKLNNEGNTPVSYKDITARYWFTADGTQTLNYYLDYAQMGNGNVKSKFVKMTAPTSMADTYLELSFTSEDFLYPQNTTGNIQQRIAKNDWSNFNLLNDHSYKTGSSMSENPKITLYVKGALVYGIEPSNGNLSGKATTEAAHTNITTATIKSKDPVVNSSLSVTVLRNPVTGNEVELIVRGAQDEQLRITLVDVHGRVINDRQLGRSGPNERIRLSLMNSVSQLFFVRVSTAKEVRTVKVVRAK